MRVRQDRSWYSPRTAAAVVLALAVAAAGCGTGTPATDAGESDDDHGDHSASRVYFVQPRDGATVSSPVQFEFGSEQFTIAAVPPGEIQQVRAGMGHYHLGVNTDCLPVGQVIPQADPWIHFGNGSNVIEMELPPGAHRFAVQAGDDEHRTLDGLCETISVNVVQ